MAALSMQMKQKSRKFSLHYIVEIQYTAKLLSGLTFVVYGIVIPKARIVYHRRRKFGVVKGWQNCIVINLAA